MVLLHQGVLSHFDCGQRMGIVFAGAILAQIFLIANAAIRRSAASNPIETLDERPYFTRRRFVVFGIWTTIVVVVGALCMASRTETLLWMDAEFVGETSCIGPFPEEYRLDRSQITVDLKSESALLTSRHSGPDYYLAISQPGKPRNLFIDLKGRENAPELVSLAPLAMQTYSDSVHGVGRR